VTVTVTDTTGRTVTTFTSGRDGRFRIDLPPSTYDLVTDRTDQPGLREPVNVVVVADRYTHVRLLLDTGIR
jgi:hypothetical protein